MSSLRGIWLAFTQAGFFLLLIILLAIGWPCIAGDDGTGVAAVDNPAKPAADAPGTKIQGDNLLTDESLAKWKRGPTNADGWTLKAGKLSGDAKSNVLVSGLTLGDFELHITWRVNEGSAIKIGMPKIPDEQGLEVRLAEEPGVTIRLPQGARSLKIAEESRGKTHTTVLRRTGDKFSLTTDGIKSREFPLPAADQFGLALSIDGGQATIESLRLFQPATAAAPNP